MESLFGFFFLMLGTAQTAHASPGKITNKPTLYLLNRKFANFLTASTNLLSSYRFKGEPSACVVDFSLLNHMIQQSCR